MGQTASTANPSTTSAMVPSSSSSTSIFPTTTAIILPTSTSILSSSTPAVVLSSSTSKADAVVASSSSTSSAPSTLQTSNTGVYSNCYYNVDGAGAFNTRWVADWTSGVTQDLTGIVSSAYTVGSTSTTTTTTTTKSSKMKRGLNSLISLWANFLSFRITSSSTNAVLQTTNSALSTVTTAGTSVASTANNAVSNTMAAVAAVQAAMSSSTQLYTSYNDILYASVRAVILLSNATGFTSYRSDTMEIDLGWLHYHSSYDTSVMSDASTAWHEYRVDWSPASTKYYIDTKLVSTTASESSPGLWLWNAFSDGNTDSVFQMRSIDAYFNRTSVNADIANGVAVCKGVTLATAAVSSVASVASSAVGTVAGAASGVVSSVAGTASSVVSAVTSAVGTVASAGTSLVGTVANAGTSVVGTAAGAAASVVGGVVGGLAGTLASSSSTTLVPTTLVTSTKAASVVSSAPSVVPSVASVATTAAPVVSSAASVTPTLSAQATVSFTTISSAWTGQTASTTTVLNGLAATVIVLTPGVVKATSISSSSSSAGYVFTTSTTDSGTFSAVQTKTILPSIGTVATVQIIYPTPVTTCLNPGVAYAGYTNSFAGGQATSGYPLFTPTVYKTAKPTQTGVTNYIAEVNSGSVNVGYYGRTTTTQNWVIDHTFYLFARQDGYYSFNIPYTDDIQLVWYGAKAISGWTRANADIVQFWSSQIAVQTPQTIAVYLTTGSYLPMRVMYANGGGAGELDFNIYGPDGSTILASNRGLGTGSSSVDIVMFPCDATLGAKFPAWGAET